LNSSSGKKRVLFICSHNSARSKMAEGLLRHLGGSGLEVHSAGTVATQVRPEAITVMQEVGIDISHQFSKTLDDFISEPFDYVITVCDSANESCPFFPNALNRWHWSIDDPALVKGLEVERLHAFRKAQDELGSRIEGQLLPAIRFS
jgi:arsenate reductase (thioredoxin)